MKSNFNLSIIILCLALPLHMARSAVIPVSEDRYSSRVSRPSGLANKPQANQIGKKSGQAAQLAVSANETAFIRFDVGDFSGLIPPDNVSSARFTFFISAAQKAGDIAIHRVTSEWTESAQPHRPPPSYDAAPLATIPAAALRAGQFAVIDVTALVKAWLASPAADFGFALVGTGSASFQVTAKEGPAQGHPAILEIEDRPVVDNTRISPGVDATKIGDGAVTNVEFGYLNGVVSSVQGQLNGIGTELATLTTAASEKVSKIGDTMTGTLQLPPNGLKVGTDHLMAKDGKIGVGTPEPAAKLDVRGDIRLGDAGQYYTPAGEENLRIIRGTLLFSDGSVKEGKGFTVTKSSTYPAVTTVTFDQPFSAPPTVTASWGVSDGKSYILAFHISSTTASEISFTGNLPSVGATIHFIAIGPR